MVKIKICGLTSLDDARAAIEAGADMLGFNFYRPSPRFIEPAKARQIVEHIKSDDGSQAVTTVGVFVNEPSLESLLAIANETRIDAVQLHGDESPEFCVSLKARLDGRLIIKALRVGADFEPNSTTNYEADAIMLDAFHAQFRGGTGRVFDWNFARQTREIVSRLFLSGGLSPENVARAIAEVQPYAVDACSSLETKPGRKDAARMKAFVRAVRNG